MKRLGALLLLIASTAVFAQVYPYFPPPYAQGVQTPGQFLTSPCGTSGAITLRSLCVSDFNGGLNASPTTFWRGDGTWQTVVSGGTVSSVGVSSTGGTLTITGSPITTSGTINVDIPTTYLASPPAIGGSTAAAGSFTTLSASSTVSGAGFTSLFASPPAIGGTAAAAGSFTTLSASSTVSGTGFSTYLASPPAIGGTAAAAGSFTTLSASSTVSGAGFTSLFASPPAIGGTSAAAGSFTTLNFSGAALGASATGGAQASGTLNAVNLYVNGTAVSTAVGANPTATVGTSAVNGSSANFMRADGAPAINLTMAPTWTAVHTFSESPASNTSTDGVVLTDPVAATAANQQFSPRVHLTGQGWKTTATAASQTVDWIIENQPVQGAANPTTNLVFSSQVNALGFNPQMTLLSTSAASSGQIQMPGNASQTAPPYSFTGGVSNWGLSCCGSVNGQGAIQVVASGSAMMGINTKGIYAMNAPFGTSGAAQPTISGCGTAGSITGGYNAFTFTVGTGATPCSFTITFGANAQPHGWICTASDQTSALAIPQTTGGSTTTCVIKASTAATSDVISVLALAY